MTGSLEQLQITFPSIPTPERSEPPPAAHLFRAHLFPSRQESWSGHVKQIGYSGAVYVQGRVRVARRETAKFIRNEKRGLVQAPFLN